LKTVHSSLLPTAAERAILVGLDLKGRGPGRASGRAESLAADVTPEESLDELATLAESAGAMVVDQSLQSRPQVDPSTLVGSGKVDELARTVKALEAGVVIFDRELSPTQLRNLERALDVKVIDRTQLILDIFARRARTREGQMQVELAQLEYLLPRLTGHGAAMSRLGGGIGTRGPGETKLETDRRRIARRMQKIRSDLETVRASRGIQRRERQAVPLATIGLVGYTNAGKSTLFNRLTGAGVVADARLFATLDPTVRQLALPSRRRVLLSDTVGFIRNLPTTLVKAFRATLEEVVEAELLLHVVDVSSDHAEPNAVHVRRVLAEIGADATPQILVLNKTDLLGEGEGTDPASIARRLLPDYEGAAVAVSARSGVGVEALLAAIDGKLALDPVRRVQFRFPVGDGWQLNLLHEGARVVDKRYGEATVEVEAEVPESLRRKLGEYIVENE
jgi:GTP-binding protein HflX